MTLPRKQLASLKTFQIILLFLAVYVAVNAVVLIHSGKNYDLFFLLDSCSCVVLISYAPVTMQNRHTPERRTVPSLSIITVDSGLKTVFVFYRYSLPLTSTFVATL
jgi:hypothetical protein